MKTISFSNQQVEFLIEQYESELVVAKEYVEQIVEILNKLGVNAKTAKENAVEKEPRQYKKMGRKPKVNVAEPKAPPKKRGRKPAIAPILEETAPVPAPKPEKKTKKTKKVKVAKKAIKELAIVKKESAKGATAIKPISNPEPSPAPKKVTKKVAKKVTKKEVKKPSVEKQRLEEMAASLKLSKPVTKKAKAKKVTKPQPKKQAIVTEPAPIVETIAAPAEVPKE